MKRLLLSFLVLVTCTTPFGFAQGPEPEADSAVARIAQFVFDDSVGRNIVMFTSKAPLETIIGRSSALYGHVKLNLDSLSDNPEAYFECDLTTLQTGIALRDEHMRSDDYLAADSFPTATFRLLSIRKTDVEILRNEAVANLSARGEFTFHGTMDSVNVTIEATYFEANEITEKRLPGDILKFKADFDIRMSDYGITIPEEVILKLDDRIHIQIDAFGGTEVVPIDRTVAESPAEIIEPGGEEVSDTD